jgi:hypothetical protein
VVIDSAPCIRASAKDVLQRFRPIAHDVDAAGEVVLFQDVERQLDVVGIVFHQQDFDRIFGYGRPPGFRISDFRFTYLLLS